MLRLLLHFISPIDRRAHPYAHHDNPRASKNDSFFFPTTFEDLSIPEGRHKRYRNDRSRKKSSEGNKSEGDKMKLLITPERALELLEKNTKNRPIKQTRLNRYARQIKNGNWEYNGETIKIASNGVILDGQHRLWAVIEADKSILVEVIYDLSPKVWDTIDQGGVRTNADNFSRQKVKNYVKVAALINPLYFLNRRRYKALSATVLTKREAFQYYEEHKNVIEGINLNRRHIKVPPKYVFACEAYLRQYNNPEAVDSFFGQLSSGQILPGFEQVFVLREWLIKMAGEVRSNPKGTEYVAKILKAYQNFKRGKNPKTIRWSEASNEAFPFDDDDKPIGEKK